jgi:hypothetical protein
MSSVLQTIYLLLLIIILAAIGLSISKLMQENSHYVAHEEKFIVPEVTPGEIKNIDWQTTDKLMSNCQVKVVFQKHTLEVTVRDKDGQIYQTTEPKIDAIFDLAKKYQGPCDIVQMITE